MGDKESGYLVNYTFVRDKASTAIDILYQSITLLEEVYEEIPEDDEYLLGVTSELLQQFDALLNKFEQNLPCFDFESKISD